MNRFRKRTFAMVICGILATTTAVWAKPAFLSTFTKTYKVSKSSALGKAGCATCHLSNTQTSKFNPYGASLQKAMKAAKATTLTKDILAKVEKQDSDKDGATNIKEIKAGTLPGDAKSHP